MLEKDKKTIKLFCIWGAVFTIVVGSLLHFLYGWTNNNIVVGLFAPINESPWEHMKLVFTPMILFSFIEYTFLKSKVKDYCFALMKEIGIAIAFILAVFYLYTSVIGHSILLIDILSFILGVIFAKWFGYSILTGMFKRYEFRGINFISFMFLLALALFFVCATFNPPEINPFLDPVTNSYGLYQIK